MKLFIDSSTDYLLLGLVNGDTVKSFYRMGKSDHSDTLIGYLKSFLKDNNVSVDDIDALFIGKGPGSYTGIRITGTVGKVLSFVKDIKFYAFSSLDLIAAGINKDGNYLIHTKAKKLHSYYKMVNVTNGDLKELQADSFGPDAEINCDYTPYTISDEYLANLNLAFKNILREHLYTEADNLDYTPNYLRSSI